MSAAISPAAVRGPATGILMADHRGIEAVLAALEQACDLLEDGAALPPGFVSRCVDLLHRFGEQYHQAKERLLFRALSHKGLGDHGGPVFVMLREHELGRAYLEAVEQADARGDRAGVISAGRAY